MLRQVEQVGPRVIRVHCSTTMENIELINHVMRMLKLCYHVFAVLLFFALPQ